MVVRLRAESEDAPEGAYAGLTELLNGKASFAEVIRRDPASRMHFISFGAPADIRRQVTDAGWTKQVARVSRCSFALAVPVSRKLAHAATAATVSSITPA